MRRFAPIQSKHVAPLRSVSRCPECSGILDRVRTSRSDHSGMAIRMGRNTQPRSVKGCPTTYSRRTSSVHGRTNRTLAPIRFRCRDGTLTRSRSPGRTCNRC